MSPGGGKSRRGYPIGVPIPLFLEAGSEQRFLSIKEPDLDRVRALLNDIIQGNGRISQLIKRIRNFTKKDALHYDCLDINEVILLRRLTREKRAA